MGNEQKFFICETCGNLIGLIDNHGVPMMCCGKKMKELVANTAEASTEKHLPAVTVSEDEVTVEVGSIFHPAEEDHHIKFVYIETEEGGQRKCLKTGQEPKVRFRLIDDKVKAVFAYCNLHGLWKTEV